MFVHNNAELLISVNAFALSIPTSTVFLYVMYCSTTGLTVTMTKDGGEVGLEVLYTILYYTI
jgi:hypothetical protein